MRASPIELPTSGGEGINGALQSVLIEVLKIAQIIIDSGSWHNVLPLVEGFSIGAVGCLLIGFAVLEIIISKCMLSILFVLAPLFIAFTLFEATQTFFDRWLGACVGYAMLMIFICAGLGIVVALDQWAIADVYENNVLSNNMTGLTAIDTAVIILVTFVCFGILKRMSILAMSIGGSITSVSGNEMFASAVGGVMGKGTLNYLRDPKTVGGKAVRVPLSLAKSYAKDLMKDLRHGMQRNKSE